MSCNVPEVIYLKQNWNHNGGWSVPNQGSHCLPFPCFAFFGEAPSMESDSWIWEEKSQVQVIRLIVRVSQAELRWVFPGGSDGKESACNAGDPGSIPRSGKSPGEGNGNPLQYSCLENPMDREAWQATAYGVAQNWTRPSESCMDVRVGL